MDNSEILLHLGESNFDGTSGSPPLYQTSNFLFKNIAEMRYALAHEDEVPFYTRGTNPTISMLQVKIAALEGMEACLAFGSGSAAISAAILANVNQGDHILCVAKPYSWTGKLLSQILVRFGVTYTLVDGKDATHFLSHIQSNTKIIYLESPNSWTFEMQDLEQIASEAKAKNILTIVDNSYASPLYQSPAVFGIDMVVHSATKFLNGHSDVVAGVLCGSKELMHKIFKSEYMTLGGIISPFEAWLIMRSLRTLPLRMKHIGESTKQVVDAIEDHPAIAKIYYPYSKHFDQPDLAKKYLKHPGGMFTIDLATNDQEKIEAFCNSLKLFKLGCSWGSYESLAFPAITTMSSLNYDNPNIVPGRIRFSVGLDEPELLTRELLDLLNRLK